MKISFEFETVLWEEHFYTADKSFQPQIPEAVACDIVVSIFWTRIGTELPADFPRMANGEPYPSGTAYELLTALEASKAKGVPDVYVFRKTADAIVADGGRRAPAAGADPVRRARSILERMVPVREGAIQGRIPELSHDRRIRAADRVAAAPVA